MEHHVHIVIQFQELKSNLVAESTVACFDLNLEDIEHARQVIATELHKAAWDYEEATEDVEKEG